MKNLIFGTGIAMCLLFVACEKENYTNTPEKNDPVSQQGYDLNLVTETLEDITPTIARVFLQNPEIMDLLVNEAAKQFDGDNDVLFETIKNRQVAGVSNFKSGQAETIMGLLEAETDLTKSTSKLSEKIAGIRDLNIYHFIPTNAASIENALFAYIPYTVNDTEVEKITAFDKFGNKTLLDAKQTPQQMVFVLGINERMGHADLSNSPAGTINQQLKSTQANHTEILKGIKITDDKEPWFKGSPEIYCLYAVGVNTSTSLKQYYPGVDKINTWYNFNDNIFSYPSDNPQFFYWITEMWEEDVNPNYNYEITGGFTYDGEYFSIKGTFRIGESDDYIGATQVYSLHSQNKIYSGGSCYWKLSWEE